jgi:hypothetical protein
VQQLAKAIEVPGTPTTAVIDKTGHVAGIIIGKLTVSQLGAVIQHAETAE